MAELSEQMMKARGALVAGDLPILNGEGLYSDRPDPTSVPAGSLYFATDTLETYRAGGANWSLYSRGGAELAYAERTSSFVTESLPFVAVPGLAATYVAGQGGAFIHYGCTAFSSDGAACVLGLFVDDEQIGQILFAADFFQSTSTGVKVSGKPAGSLVSVEIRARHSVGGGPSFTVFGDPTDRPFLRVVTC